MPTVDSYEFGVVPDTFSEAELKGEAFNDGTDYKLPNGTDATNDAAVLGKTTNIVETKPHFYAWATATTGMLAVARKQRSTFRNYVAAETAAPVIACAAGKGPLDELDFQFAGIVRSNSVRTMDDGVGPTTDEYFTLTIGGPATILNNSKEVIHAGDTIAWTFYSESQNHTGSSKRAAHGSVRRIGIRIADFHDECKIGKAINFAKRNSTIATNTHCLLYTYFPHKCPFSHFVQFDSRFVSSWTNFRYSRPNLDGYGYVRVVCLGRRENICQESKSTDRFF